MPNLLPAAAEGLPKPSRRTAVVAGGAALITALAGVAGPVSLPDHVPVALHRILAEYAEAHTLLSKALEREARASGTTRFERAERAADAAIDRMAHAFRALIEHPCDTLGEVRAKVAVLLAAPPAFGGELEYAEARTLLTSFEGAKARASHDSVRAPNTSQTQ